MKKLLATILVFLFLLSMTAQPVRAQGILTDFFEMIKNWFESSPLGNLFAMPIKRIETISLSFYPQTFEFDIGEYANITTNTSEISNFKGKMNVDMASKSMYLQEEGTSLMIREYIGEIRVDDFKISSLDLKNMKLVISSGNWNETTENGSVTIRDFLGNAIVKDGMITLEGNVSRIDKE